MTVQQRIRKYRESGGAADLVRVEVLVPVERRADILASAAAMRSKHRNDKARQQQQIDEALARYGTRILDNIDLDRLPDLVSKTRVVANALIERGDAKAYALGRRMLSEL